MELHPLNDFVLVTEQTCTWVSLISLSKQYIRALRIDTIGNKHINNVHVYELNCCYQIDRLIYSQPFTMLQMMDTKFIETCKVELANNILKFTIQNHVSQTYQPISFAILYTYMYNYVRQ